jgi:type II secretory pathway pseudopilin PulG
MMTLPPSPSWGFSLFELTMVLVVIGALSLLTSRAFHGIDSSEAQSSAEEKAHVARSALRYFALANKRLPCPDPDGDGYENVGGDGRCLTMGETGFLPYHTLGLAEMAHNRMRYAVYRASSDNDLTRRVERTGDAEGAPDYMGLGDFIVALEDIPASVTDASHPRVATVQTDGASDCGVALYPAFALIVPNQDKDNDSHPEDGENSGSGPCIASPLQSRAWNYDDVVVSESPDSLVGWIVRNMN